MNYEDMNNTETNGYKQIKFGAIISYLLLAINTAYGLLLTPFLIKNLGTDEYGLYKLVGSISGSLVVFNLGIGETVQRYVSLYVARGEEGKVPNLMGMCLRICALLNIAVLIVGIIVVHLFPMIYGNSLQGNQLDKGIIMLIVLIANIMIILIENIFSGLLAGYNQFIFINTTKLVIVLLRAIVTFIAIKGGKGAIFLVATTLGLSIIALIAEWIYSRDKLGVKIRFENWDKSLFREAGKYTALMFMTALTSQIFTNVDSIVIGAVLGTTIVTLYSIAQYFFDMFQQLSCAISGVMLPTITKTLQQKNGLKEAERIVIRTGRIQFMILGAAFAGILVTGKEFIYLWLGKGKEDIYIVTIILVGPTLFELCTNVCNSILAAMNKIAYRTHITFISAIANAILTVILVKYWSYMGAAVATAISYIVCNLIMMNIYYTKEIKINIVNIYGKIIKRTILCIIIPMLCLLIINHILYGSWFSFLTKVIIFGAIYLSLLLSYGFSPEEKQQIPIVRNVVGRKR